MRDEESGTFPVEHPIKEPAQVESHPFPDPDRADLFAEAKERAKEVDRSQCLLFGDNGWGLFERAWLLVGMERLFLWMVEEPEAVKLLLHRIAEVKIRLCERYIEEVGVDGIMFGDDWGWEEGLLMGPRLWREFIKPEQERLYRVCKEAGVLVYQHSDGRVEEVVSDLAGMGLDILNPVQPECNDLEGLKSQYGHLIAFHGAVSSRVLHQGNPQEVEEEVRLRISQLGKGGGYILGPAHWVPYPEENLRAFKEAARKYGRYPLPLG